MKLILLSGGSGKRLWPLSNDSRSKQFLKVLQNEDGQAISMLQRIYNQLDSVGLINSTIISTSKAQVDMIQNQLDDKLPLVIEPERRDTFPAIALSCMYLYSKLGVNENEVITVLPVDSFVEKEFFLKVKELERVLLSSKSKLALIGVTPTFPSEKYGYIIPEKAYSNYIKVSHFIEKPNTKIAEELISQMALWNCGVFAFQLNTIVTELTNRNLPTDYDDLIKEYSILPKTSFDYEIVEKEHNITAISYNGSWKDLGTWNTLTEEMEKPIVGKGIVSNDCMNTHLINELDIPVTILGLSNIVVAVSADGILVTDKTASPRIKEVVSIFDQRPMYEERRWGWYRVLDYTKFENINEVLTKRIVIRAGKNLSYQKHFKRDEVWTIISGEGLFVLDDILYQVKSGDVLKIPVEAKHAIRAITDLQFIEVQTGSELIEEDIIRITTSWEEIESCCQETREEQFGYKEVAVTKDNS